MKYIMITHWDNHWDKLPNNETSYNVKMFKPGMNLEKIAENTQTIFIQLNKETKKPEKAWKGRVHGLKRVGNTVHFKVDIEGEIQATSKYTSEGWYIEDIEEETLNKTIFYPPFFQTLENTNSWKEFEDYTYCVLKLLGIHNIHKYEEQKGEADGFFKFKNLAVIYDCTLESNFEDTKETQINNFCTQLKSGKIKYKNIIIDVAHCKNQVWIITMS